VQALTINKNIRFIFLSDVDIEWVNTNNPNVEHLFERRYYNLNQVKITHKLNLFKIIKSK